MSKYNAVKITIDGRTFDSKKEAERYSFLSMLANRMLIQNLRCQVPYELVPAYVNVAGKKIRAITYRADFVYIQDGVEHVEDVKGFRTKEYLLKKKLFEYIYKRIIEEV